MIWPCAAMCRKIAIVLILSAAPLIAQVVPNMDAPPTVHVQVEGFTEVPALTDTGGPRLDENGLPVFPRVPVADSIITPGDTVIYVITVENQTEQPAANMSVTAVVAAEVTLDPFSFVYADGVVVTWADTENPNVFRPLFEIVDGDDVMTADLDLLRFLRLQLPELPPANLTRVEYKVTLR
jgi:uncharacterized repeat protein (TIGR01451 family)